jgi:hypothetical protein
MPQLRKFAGIEKLGNASDKLSRRKQLSKKLLGTPNSIPHVCPPIPGEREARPA